MKPGPPAKKVFSGEWSPAEKGTGKLIIRKGEPFLVMCNPVPD